MKKIVVQASTRNYPYYTGSGVLNKAAQILQKSYGKSHIFFIIDENVLKLHKQYILDAFGELGVKRSITALKHGEGSKSFPMLQKILTEMLANGCDRNTLVVAIGGGVPGDLAGFAASVYKRGVDVVHVPTTLLAMIDSSVGGKTGINFSGYKNIIGTFYQPTAVIADTVFLQTLPEREFNAGLGEAVKYAFLGDMPNYKVIGKFLTYWFSETFKRTGVDTPPPPGLDKLISNCVAIKAGVVAQDEHETGLRKILNLGHTFAHAIETLSKYKVYHGEAVAAGLLMALQVSNRIGVLSQTDFNEFSTLVSLIPRPAGIKKMPVESLVRVMQQDKKNKNGEIRFVLVKSAGELLVDVPVSHEVLTSAIKAYL